MELEFLKPHIPTVEEKADPVLFASNVRKEMAAALGIQLCDLRWPGFSLVKFSIYFPQFRGHQEQVYQEEQGRLGETIVLFWSKASGAPLPPRTIKKKTGTWIIVKENLV